MNKKTLLIAASLCGLAASSHAQTGPAPVAWYKFDEAAGATTAVNSVIGSTNGTISGDTSKVTTGVAGISGNAYQFTKATAGGFVDMGNANFFGSINTAKQLTISTWISTSSTLSTGVRNVAIFAGDDTKSQTYLDMGFSGSGPIAQQAYARNRPVQSQNSGFGDIASGSSVGNSSWHHVVMTLDVSGVTGTLSLYIDGAFVTSASQSGVNNALPTFNNFEIGRLGRSSPTDYFGGLIDDVQVYNSTLTAGQVNWLYNNPGQALTAVPEPGEVSLAIAAGLGFLVVMRFRRLAGSQSGKLRDTQSIVLIYRTNRHNRLTV